MHTTTALVATFLYQPLRRHFVARHTGFKPHDALSRIAARWPAIGLVAACLVLLTGCVPRNVEVTTHYGKVLGLQSEQGTKFLGVPYAQAPIGALRWADPQPLEAWAGTLDATQFGHACTQYVPITSPTLRSKPDEDCLKLNIWMPNTPGPHPVMMFVHGGGGVYGSGNEIQYDGAKLATNQNVVVVSANYRIWASGFLALPPLGSRPAVTGNQTIKDLIAALRWIHTEIEAFSGDPGNVTVFGESAGSVYTCALLATPTTKTPVRLMHRAIMQSGACDTFEVHSLAEAQAKGLELIDKLGCGNAPEPLDCARNTPINQVRSVAMPMETLYADGPLVTHWAFGGPAIDGEVFPKHPFELLATPQANPTPAIIGSNKDEGSLFALMTLWHPKPEGYARFLERVFPGQDAVLASLYPITDYISTGAAHAAILGDQIMHCPSLNLAQIYSAAGNPVWLYAFNYPVHGLFNSLAKVILPPSAAQLDTYHATDLSFLFEIPGLAAINTDTDKMMVHQFQESWGNFARTGNPNGTTVAPWQAFEPGRDNYLYIDATPQNRDGYKSSYCGYWIQRAHAHAVSLK